MSKQLNAANIASKWGNRVSQSGQSYSDGVNAVTEAPGARALSSLV